MPNVLYLVLALALTAAVALRFLYWRFRRSPAARWRDRVRRHLDDLRRRAQFEADPDDSTAKLARLADDLFRRHLGTVSVDTLDAYPGIGPATVGKLWDAGLLTVADLTGFDFRRLPGIGPAKAAELAAAVRAVVREARSRFDAGASPEGQEHRRMLAALRAEERDRLLARERVLAAVDDALRQTEELDRLARDVTFLNHLLRRPVPGLTDEVMARPLPIPRPADPQPFVGTLVDPPAPPAPGPRPPSTVVEHPDLPKMRAVIRFAFAVARADGRVAKAETEVIRGYLGRAFGHDPVLVRHIDPLMEQMARAVPAEAAAVAEVVALTGPDERAGLYAVAERIADASGERNQKERDALARIAAAFGLPTASPPPPPPPAPAKPTEADHRAALEIDPGVPLAPDLIRRRYTLLTEKLDPAKAATLGPEFASMAEAKRTTIRAAAEALIAPFGVPLDPPAAPPPPTDLRHNPDLDDVFGG